MAYNNKNKIKEKERIVAIYKKLKHEDVPNTRIVKQMAREHGVFISYSTLKNILSFAKKNKLL